LTSPFGKAVSLDGDGDTLVIPHDDSMNVGDGDFYRFGVDSPGPAPASWDRRAGRVESAHAQ
jgi:hypothetical protein